jgi:hypothetical protein
MKFYNSRFYGTVVHVSDGHTDDDPAPNPALASYFESCTFEDKPWTDGTVKRSGALINIASDGDGVTFKNCTFRNHRVKAASVGDDTTHEHFDGCTFMTDNETLSSGDSQAYFAGSTMKSVLFRESSAIASGSRNYSINVSNVRVLTPDAGALPTRLDTQRVHWDTPTGKTGTISPGVY